MVGTNGTKMPKIRAHMQRVLGDVYVGIEPQCIETWPADDESDAEAYKRAVLAFEPGDVAIIFTPDDTHGPIAAACLARGCAGCPHSRVVRLGACSLCRLLQPLVVVYGAGSRPVCLMEWLPKRLHA